MITHVEEPNGEVAELRREFDAIFAAPPLLAGSDESERFLAVQIGRDAYALRIVEISGLAEGRKLIPLPSAMSEMIGLAGVRGQVVPVYSLASLLGHRASGEAPRWFVLSGSGSTEVVGLAFDALDGYLELPRASVHSTASDQAGQKHIRDTLRAEGRVRSVIDLPSVVDTIKQRIGALGTIKER